MTDSVNFDRLGAVLIGAACGDALGAGYEFGHPVPQSDPVVMRGQGAFAPGEWTDDTAQLIAIARAAADGHDLSAPAGEDAVASYFQQWYLSPAASKDIGMHTSSVMGEAFRAASDGLANRLRAAADDKEKRSPGRSGGNGALMRTAAVAVALHDDPPRMVDSALRLASMTHADDRSSESCAVWCLAIRRALRTPSWDEAGLVALRDGVIADVAVHLPQSAAYWADVLSESFGTSAVDYYGCYPTNGYSVTALRAAWAAVTGTPMPVDEPALHLRRAIEAAVRGGGDTDTVACIAGALLGAMWGYSAVPLTWRRRIFGWPGYRDADLLRLAYAVSEHGRVTPAKWPFAEHMDYTGWSGVDAVAVHPFDDDVVIGGILAARGQVELPGGPVDAVVSLCRVGTEDLTPLRLAPENCIEVRLIDLPGHDDNPHLSLVLDGAADLIATLRGEGKRVLLHCVAAQSRTPTVAAMYSIRKFGIAPAKALSTACAVLPAAHPNSAFVDAVMNS